IALLTDPLVNFEENDRWNDQLALVFNRGCKERSVRSVGEIFQPGRGIDQIHTRSLSRGTLVSMPARNPRICRAVRTGSSSIRPSSSITLNVAPGFSFMEDRTAFGITIWNFGERVVRVINRSG